MKTKIIALCTIINCALSIINSQATVLTISNDLAGGAQYNNVQAAIAASANGDTLLIEGTNVAYPAVDDCNGLTKSLTFIGIGYNPNKANARKTIFSHIDCVNFGAYNGGFGLNSGSTGSKFYGIEFQNPILPGVNLSNVDFYDCQFDQNVNFGNYLISNFVFQNCVFTNNVVNVWFANNNAQQSSIGFTSCVFNGYVAGNNNTNLSSILWDHCLFLTTTAGYVPLQGLYNCTIQNSIIANQATVLSGGTGNTFNNNIVRQSVTMPPVGNFGANNLPNTDPQFVNYTLNTYYNSNYDFHLQAGSPAIGASTAVGADIGPHGSSSHYSETGEVLINPIVRSLNINNTTVAPNGNLNVNINATKPTDN